MAQVTIDVEKVETMPADNRGRVNLGSKYADEDVEIAVIGIDKSHKSESSGGGKGHGVDLLACPECGSYDLGVEDMGDHGSDIHCKDCGCSIQVG